MCTTHYNTAPTIRLQDGTYFNFKRRLRKNAKTLLCQLSKVSDPRADSGKRHALSSILFILFSGITCGNTDIKNCCIWAQSNSKFLKMHISLPHGISHPTTISRTLQILDPKEVVSAFSSYRRIMFGWEKDMAASFDGKTIRAAKGENIVSHILSLFTLVTHQTIAQVGVNTKENEIPASYRLLDAVSLAGYTLLADALHCQKDTAHTIREKGGNYILIVKDNQKDLKGILTVSFDDPKLKKNVCKHYDTDRGRDITTTVEVSTDCDLIDLAKGWADIAIIGKIKRYGTRKNKGEVKYIDETVYFISSKILTAHDAFLLIRKHWNIENNLHWTKDYIFLEDRQRLRLGNAPQIMTFLRSCVIGLFNLIKVDSIAESISILQKNKELHHRFLVACAVC